MCFKKHVSMNYKRELKDIISKESKTGVALSNDIGMSYDYFRSSTQNKGLRSRLWVRAFVIGYMMGKKNKVNI